MNKWLFFLAFISVAGNTFGQPGKVFVSGSNWLQVALIDKQTKQIEWTYDLNPGEDCENITLTPKGELLISYKQGAKLINAARETIWDYPVEGKGELYSATLLDDGGYLLACSGHPAKIIELDARGREQKVLTFDTGVENLHGQLRQIIKSNEGTYLVPVMSKGVIVELEATGKEVRRFEVEGNPFSVLELKNGNLLVSCGDAHMAQEVERYTGESVRQTGARDIEGMRLNFVAQIVELDNGNKLICNWNGHAKGDETLQPALIEIDENNQLVWSLEEGNGIGKISCVFPVADAKAVSQFIQNNHSK